MEQLLSKGNKKVILKRFISKNVFIFAKQLNMKRMKKIGYLAVLVVFMLTGCSSKPGNDGGQGQATGDSNTTSTVSDGASSTGKPEHLTKETFREKIMDYEKNPNQWVYEGDKPAIVDFYADWCRPCRMISPIMEELAVEYQGKVNFYKVDTDAERELASVFGIQSLPTVIFIPVKGNPSLQMGAMSKDFYKETIDKVLLGQGTGQ
jgi:thioredoxin 1